MSEFKYEDDILSYRRLCEAITNNPTAWDRFFRTIGERDHADARRSSAGKLVFKQALKRIKKLGERIAAEETEFWRIHIKE